MHVTFLVFSLAACTGTPAETDTSGETDTVDTVDTETDDPGPQGTLEGTVIDDAGAPVAGARVNFCRGVCATTETDAQGHYSTLVTAQVGSFYVREESALLDAIVPLAVAENETRTVDVTLFHAETTVTIPAVADEIEVGPGFFLTVGVDTLEPAIFEDLGTTIASTQVPVAQVLPIEVDAAHGALVAAYYFAPFEAFSTSGLPFRIDNTFGLPANTALVAFAASGPDLYTWLPAGEVAVSADGTSIEGGSLPILTTLVLFQAP